MASTAKGKKALKRSGDEQLILEVGEFPALYNVFLPEYMDINKKSFAWQTVASRLKMDGELKRWVPGANVSLAKLLVNAKKSLADANANGVPRVFVASYCYCVTLNVCQAIPRHDIRLP